MNKNATVLSVVFSVTAVGCAPRSAPPSAAAAAPFSIEEATIAGVHTAIKSGSATCEAASSRPIIARAKAYNGVCTALVTADGADIEPA